MSNTRKKKKRIALVVLGMHRSGTSALAGVLAKLGAEPPKTLMPPTSDNPKGYWESSALMQFNDAVLASAGTSWDDWDSIDAAWVDTLAGQAAMSELPSLLEQEFGRAPLFLVKDPRICRLLPLWLRTLSDNGIDSKIVLPFRNPAEVAKSLGVRDGITPLQARLIWLRHVLDAESFSRGCDRVFVRYEDILIDWRLETKRIERVLGLSWPRRSGSIEAEIDAYLTKDLRRNVESARQARSTPIAAWVADAYALMCELAEGRDHDDVRRKLDEIRQSFEMNSKVFLPLIHEIRADLLGKIEKECSNNASAKEMLDALNEKNKLLRQECVINYDLAMKYKVDFESERERLRDRETSIAAMEVRYLVGQDELGRMREASEDAAKVAESAGSEIERVRRESEESSIALRTINEEISSRNESLEARIFELQTECAEARNKFDRMKDRIYAAELSEERRLHEQGVIESVYQAKVDGLERRLYAETMDLREKKRVFEEAAQERTSEVVVLTLNALALEKEISEKNEAISALKSEVVAREISIEAKKHRLEDQAVHIRVLLSEMEAVSGIVSGYRHELEGIHASNWLTLPGHLRRRAGKAIAVVAPELAAGAVEALLGKSVLFDKEWYLSCYADVRKHKMDPVKHYLGYGASEGRDPGPAFSTSGYLRRYPDVAIARINPLFHYLIYGRKEGRSISVSGTMPGKKGVVHEG